MKDNAPLPDALADSEIALRLCDLIQSLARGTEPAQALNVANTVTSAGGLPVVLLPVTRFDSADDSESLIERATLALHQNGVGPANVRNEIADIFDELTMNAAQHSRSRTGCYATIEYNAAGSQIVYFVGIIDSGIGIRTSLQNNPNLRNTLNDADAIAYATELGVTGTSAQRGVGLDYVTSRVRAYGGNLDIVSSAGYLSVTTSGETVLGEFPSAGRLAGTLALVTLTVPGLRQS